MSTGQVLTTPAPPTDATKAIPLSWARCDIEQRLGFRGGRYTRAGSLLAFVGGLLLSVLFYAALIPIQGTYFGDMFTQRGPTQYPTVLFSFWSAVILIVKSRKLAFQRQALDRDVVPHEHDFVLSSATVDQVMDRIYATVDDPRHFVLFNRIVVALSNLRNLGRVTDVDEILNSQADQDEETLETSYSLITGFIWAIPVLGFIGTVLGLSQAISAFGAVLGDVQDIGQITTALKGVTAGLSTAFETTLAALVAALFIQLWLIAVKTREHEFLEQCSEYCLRNVVSRLRIMPFQSEGD
jgi:biopolymer transport protein ExbB/TolQ